MLKLKTKYSIDNKKTEKLKPKCRTNRLKLRQVGHELLLRLDRLRRQKNRNRHRTFRFRSSVSGFDRSVIVVAGEPEEGRIDRDGLASGNVFVSGFGLRVLAVRHQCLTNALLLLEFDDEEILKKKKYKKKMSKQFRNSRNNMHKHVNIKTFYSMHFYVNYSLQSSNVMK
jgi:hypothetical protein